MQSGSDIIQVDTQLHPCTYDQQILTGACNASHNIELSCTGRNIGSSITILPDR